MSTMLLITWLTLLNVRSGQGYSRSGDTEKEMTYLSDPEEYDCPSMTLLNRMTSTHHWFRSSEDHKLFDISSQFEDLFKAFQHLGSHQTQHAMEEAFTNQTRPKMADLHTEDPEACLNSVSSNFMTDIFGLQSLMRKVSSGSVTQEGQGGPEDKGWQDLIQMAADYSGQQDGACSAVLGHSHKDMSAVTRSQFWQMMYANNRQGKDRMPLTKFFSHALNVGMEKMALEIVEYFARSEAQKQGPRTGNNLQCWSDNINC